MKWKLQEKSSVANVRYRTLVESDHFLLQESRMGTNKARIITKPCIGNLVICSASSVAELGEAWELCKTVHPTLDSRRRPLKDSIVTQLKQRIPSAQLLSPEWGTRHSPRPSFPSSAAPDSSNSSSTATSTMSISRTTSAVSSISSSCSSSANTGNAYVCSHHITRGEEMENGLDTPGADDQSHISSNNNSHCSTSAGSRASSVTHSRTASAELSAPSSSLFLFSPPSATEDLPPSFGSELANRRFQQRSFNGSTPPPMLTVTQSSNSCLALAADMPMPTPTGPHLIKTFSSSSSLASPSYVRGRPRATSFSTGKSASPRLNDTTSALNTSAPLIGVAGPCPTAVRRNDLVTILSPSHLHYIAATSTNPRFQSPVGEPSSSPVSAPTMVLRTSSPQPSPQLKPQDEEGSPGIWDCLAQIFVGQPGVVVTGGVLTLLLILVLCPWVLYLGLLLLPLGWWVWTSSKDHR